MENGAGGSRFNEASISCDAEDGVDHYIYTDPEADRAVWESSQLNLPEVTTTTTTTGVSATTET